MTQMDPELALALADVPMGPTGVLDLSDLGAARAQMRAMVEAGAALWPDIPSVAVEVMGAVGGARDVEVRVLRPTGVPGPLPAFVWFHGGGQILGFAAQDDLYLKPLCARAQCIAVSVEYRLAPEAPAPAAAEDGLVVLRWLRREAAALGIDPRRIGIAGQSGGGGIAAAVALMARDAGDPPALFQALLYPMLDDRDATPSTRTVPDIGIWNRAHNLAAWRFVLGGRADVPAVCAPARATDLSGLPPAFVAVGDLDIFRDEDVDFATRLIAAGVPTELHVWPGAYHAFDVFAPGSSLAAALRDAWYAFTARRFHDAT